MTLPIVKQKYTPLQAKEDMDSLKSYIYVNENEYFDAIISRRLNQL